MQLIISLNKFLLKYFRNENDLVNTEFTQMYSLDLTL